MGSKKLKICVAGATGWTGSALVAAILKSTDFELSAAVSRSAAGKDIGEVLKLPKTGILTCASVAEALNDTATDILIDYTSSSIVKANAIHALNQGVRVVIGTSGLTADDYAELQLLAERKSLGVIAAGNFSITAALAKHFSLLAAEYLPQREIIDYAHAEKLDVPSGTVRELAETLAKVSDNKLGRPVNELNGPKDARGANIAGTQVHSVRLPSYVIAFETIFGDRKSVV